MEELDTRAAWWLLVAWCRDRSQPQRVPGDKPPDYDYLQYATTRAGSAESAIIYEHAAAEPAATIHEAFQGLYLGENSNMELPRMTDDLGNGNLERDKHFSITGPDEGIFRAKASLKDTQHTMEVSMAIREGTMEVMEVQGSITCSPHSECPAAVEGLQNLVGMFIRPGLFSEMQRRVGGYKGCIHMNELIRESVQLVAAHRNLTEIRRMQASGRTKEEIFEWAEEVRSWTCVAVPEPLSNG